MSKFCQNCGVEMEDDALFCVNCGAKEQVEAETQPATDIVSTVKDAVDNVVEDVKANPKLLAFAGGAVAVVVAVIILLANLFGGGWKKAIDNYVDVSFKGKANKIEKLAPKEYWEYLEDEDEDFDLKDAIEEYEDEFEDMMDDLEDEYGKNLKIKAKIEDKEKLSKKDISKIADALKDEFDIKKKSVKKGYEVDVDLTIKGSEDEDSDETTLTVIKIGSKWYIVSYYEYDDEVYVNFATGM